MQTSRQIETLPERGAEKRALHIAVVSARDGILFTALEPSVESVLARLAEYVERNASRALWPRDAERLARLVAMERAEAAIDLYFARVGDRWDAEFLHRQVVELDQ